MTRDEANKTGVRPQGMSLTMQQRAALFLIVLIAILGGGLSYIFYQAFDSSLRAETQKRGLTVATSLAENATFGLLTRDELLLSELIEPYVAAADIHYVALQYSDGTEAIVAGDLDGTRVVRADMAALMQGQRSQVSTFENNDDPALGGGLFHVAMPVWRSVSPNIHITDLNEEETTDLSNSAGSELLGLVQVGMSLASNRTTLRDAMRQSLIVVIGMTVIGIMIAVFALHRWLTPLKAVSAMAREIRSAGSDTDASNQSIDLRGIIQKFPVSRLRRDEIGKLHHTFMEMLEQLDAYNHRSWLQKADLQKMVEERTEELLRAKEMADAANIAKSTFLASTSHELRTPLNAIIGFTEMITAGYASKKAKHDEYMDLIHKIGQHLLSLINDILDLSKLEAGRYEIEPEEISLKECVDQVFSLNEPMIAEKRQTIRVSCPDLKVVNDARVMKQIFLNLVSNAVKFTPEEGSISFEVEERDTTVEICINDTGCGMHQDEVDLALQPFVQISSSKKELVKDYDGTGLGLPIVAKYVGLMDGQLNIRSEKDVGTTVQLTIPKLVTFAEA